MTTQGLEIAVTNLTKRFGAVLAVDDLTMRVAPGRVTGFLGPNGAGKTTTLRILLGLVAPTAGTALIGGHRYRDLPDPVGTVGAALEASGFHPGRSPGTTSWWLPPRRASRSAEWTRCSDWSG